MSEIFSIGTEIATGARELAGPVRTRYPDVIWSASAGFHPFDSDLSLRSRVDNDIGITGIAAKRRVALDRLGSPQSGEDSPQEFAAKRSLSARRRHGDEEDPLNPFFVHDRLIVAKVV